VNLFVGALTLFVALVISAVAGFFSVIGLGHLFAGAFWPVIIMGSALETGKLVAATWLKANWTNPAVTHKHRLFLLAQTLVLMLITSLGIYGYLAKGHLEQEAGLPAITLRISQGERRISQIGEERARLEERLKGLDQAVQALLTNARTAKETQAADRARQAQRRDRLDIAKQIAAKDKEVNAVNDELVPLRLQISDVSAKLGPVKYVAQLFGWHDPNTAVQMVILMIMFAFDPLAVVLVLSGTLMIGEYLRERRAAQASSALKNVPLTDMAEHLEDLDILDAHRNPRPTLVTELPKGENLPEVKGPNPEADLDYFRAKLAAGHAPLFNADPPPEFVPPPEGERPFAEAVVNTGETAAANAAEMAPETAPETEPTTNAAATASIDVAALSAAHETTKAELADLTTKHEALVESHGELVAVARAAAREKETLKADLATAQTTIETLSSDLDQKQAELTAAHVQIEDLTAAAEAGADEATTTEAMANVISHAMGLESEIVTLKAQLAEAEAQVKAPFIVPPVYDSVMPVTKVVAAPTARLANTSWGALGAAWKPAAHAPDLETLPPALATFEPFFEPTTPTAGEAPAAETFSAVSTAFEASEPNAKILTASTPFTNTGPASVDFHAFSESMFKARDK
jgi:hypothetical protein